MKKILISLALACIILFSGIISATEESDFIGSITDAPLNYEIVIGNLSDAENTAASNLSNITEIPIYHDYEEEYTEGLIILGSGDKNALVSILGDDSLGKFYILNNNMFIVGNSQENTAKINQLIKEIQNYTVGYEEDFAENTDLIGIEDTPDTEDISSQDAEQTVSPTNEVIVDDSGAGVWKSSTTIPAIILGIIALGIIAVFVISFLRRPN
jgi:hypothetical protein